MNRYNIKHKNGLLYENVFIVKDLSDYNEYFQILNSKFDVSKNEIKNPKVINNTHEHSDLTDAIKFLASMHQNKDEMLKFELVKLESTVITNQIKYILDGNVLIINKNGGYFPSKENEFEIIEEIKEYKKSDIKISKWIGGKHFYCKIDNIDVVDDKGNVKWNSEEDAEIAGEKFLEKLNLKKLP